MEALRRQLDRLSVVIRVAEDPPVVVRGNQVVRRDALFHKFVIATEDVPAHRGDARSLTQSLEVERHSFDRGSSCRVVRVDVRLEVIEYGLRVGQVERIPFADSEEGHLAERHNPGGVTVEIPTTVLVEDFFSSPRHGADSDRLPRCRQHHVTVTASRHACSFAGE